ncbi:Histone deacetylase [Trichinella spiralis]|uniref:Histone deacetylase n=1 Tax=Trichinella spiralis TaxID=6334 RepID=A0ABR3KWY9_TRISP
MDITEKDFERINSSKLYAPLKEQGKWGRVYNKLVKRGYINEQHICRPREAHSDNGSTIVDLLPGLFRLAIECGAAVNLGGGFHHCSSKSGGGFCPYADITLAIKFLFAQRLVEKVMIVDLDAHQDMYNCDIYPRDVKAKKAIRKAVEIKSQTSDQRYFSLLKKALDEAVLEFQPQLVLYNAGTDSLTNDPLGNLDLSPTAILQRDELIFKTFRKSNPAVPIAMVFSGGYQRNSAEVIANSLGNLIDKGYINVI